MKLLIHGATAIHGGQHLELTKTQVAGSACEGFFLMESLEMGRPTLNTEFFEVGRSTLNLATPPVGSLYKEHGRKQLRYLPACPHSCWQVHSPLA